MKEKDEFGLRAFSIIMVFAMILGTVAIVDVSENASATEYVSGSIASNTTWTAANSPYIVIGDVIVESGVTLAIEPDVDVKFDGLYSLIVNGTLNASGTPSQPITFTSNQSSPAKGDWLRIRLQGANNTLNNCKIIYGNYPLYIMGSDTNNNISNCWVFNNVGDSIYLKETTGNTIFNTTVSSSESYGISLLYSEDNIIANSTIEWNGAFGIYFDSSKNNRIENTTVRYNTGKGIKLGPNSDHIIMKNLTIYHNYDIGIDLGGNGYNNISYSLIEKNEGTGIDFGGTGAHNAIWNTTVIYNNGTGIDLKGASYVDIIGSNISKNKNKGGIYSEYAVSNITIMNSEICNNFEGDGINFFGAKWVNITNSNISGNAENGISFDGSDIQENNLIQNCTIAGNSNNGIYYYAYNFDSDTYIQNNNIYSNTIHLNNQNGIYLYTYAYAANDNPKAYAHIQNNNIFSNTIFSNIQNGIYLYAYKHESQRGYTYIQNNNIYSNTIYLNNQNGIYLYSHVEPDTRGYAYTQNNNIYSNTIYLNNQNGIYLYSHVEAYTYGYAYIQYNNIYLNTIFSNDQNGIYFYGYVYYQYPYYYSAHIVSNNLFSNTIFSNKHNGIYFHASSADSYIQNNNIYSNTIYSNNQNGVYFYVYAYAPKSYYSYIQNNNIYSNTISQHSGDNGIYFKADKPAVTWQESNLYNNTITSNKIGIRFLRIKSHVISSNNLSYNMYDAIFLEESIDNTIRYNTILGTPKPPEPANTTMWTGTYDLKDVIVGNFDFTNPGYEVVIVGHSHNATLLKGSSSNWDNITMWDSKKNLTCVAMGNFYPNSFGNEIVVGDDSGRVSMLTGSGTSWTNTTIYTNSSTEIMGVAVGEFDSTRAENETVAVTSDGEIIEIYWNGSAWNNRVIWTDDAGLHGVAVGEFDYISAGMEIVVVGSSNNATKINGTGAIWTATQILNTTYSLLGVAIDDFDDESAGNEVVVCGVNNITKINGSGSNWTAIVMYNATDTFNDVAVDDIDRTKPGDEVMVVTSLGYVIMLNGSDDNWTGTTLWNSSQDLYGVAIGEFDSSNYGKETVVVGAANATLQANTTEIIPEQPTIVGIDLTSSSEENIIKNNNVSRCLLGVLVTDSSNLNLISRNDIVNNSVVGVYITGAIDNKVNHNNFKNNSLNAYDSSNALNNWDDGAEGNWWSDYTGFDGNGDGIGDIPYDVPGGSSRDWYPLMDSVNITAPIVEATTPIDGAIEVPVNPQISITFSKEMNKTATENAISMSGGVTLTNFVWSNGNKTLTFEPISSLNYATTYTVTVSTDAKDLLENHLESTYQFSFTTEDVVAPQITVTSPANGAPDVALNADIIVTFSEAMNTSTVTHTCSPDPGGWSVEWSGGNTVATYSHNDFGSKLLYTFQITGGEDIVGNDVVGGPVPNPWTFTSEDVVGPAITSTSPSDGATGVLLSAYIVVNFDEQMNTSSVTYSCTPNPGGWSASWSNGDQTITYSHDPFDGETTYTFHITGGKDAVGNNLNPSIPNPWTFTTEDVTPPEITVTSPLNGATDVALNANVIVVFSEPMTTGTVTYTSTPNPSGWSVVWSGGDTVATYSHNPFSEKTGYTFQITGAKDVAGNNLVAGTAPNPWSFTTEDVTSPQITVTSPVDGAIDVPLSTNIVVSFSEPMNNTTVIYTCLPDPGGWTVAWSGGNTMATFSHNQFDSSLIYTFQITGGIDLGGNDLIGGVVPNPWAFTIEDALAPTIISTSPTDGVSDVVQTANIVVIFNETMDISSITYLSSPNPGGWSVIWSGGDTVATFLHDPFDSYITYTFQITSGKDLAGNDLAPGTVPNPFSFTTTDTTAPTITMTSPLDGAINIGVDQDVIITFSEAMNTSSMAHSCFPNPGGWSISWSSGDTVATFSHNSFNVSTIYTFLIANAKDVADNNLAGGGVPNPWAFITIDTTPPEIIATSPSNTAIDIDTAADVIVTFSEEMNTATVAFSCTPDPSGWSVSWNSGNNSVTYSHNAFDEMTTYTFRILSGKDIAGNDLVAGAVPNPWSFTIRDNTRPMITATTPSDGTLNIGLDQDIIITFSEPMDNITLTYTCLPNPGGWSVVWSGGNTVATYSHNPFSSDTTYTFQITGVKDLAGNGLVVGAISNPWSFSTIDTTSPTIALTSPTNGTVDVGLATNVVVVFSEAMITSSVAFTCSPDPGGWSIAWSAGDIVVTFSHDKFDKSTTYAFWIVSGIDIAGNDLVAGSVPNPMSFTTVSNTPPTILSTPIITATEDVQYTYDVEAIDNDGDILTYILTTYPTGMTINASTGLITWTPINDFVGNNSVVVLVSDGDGGVDSQSFTINVTNVNDPPTITSTPITTATEDMGYSYDVDASDPDSDTLTYGLSTCPTGMSIDSATGLILWTPTNDQVGDNNVVVLISDGNGGTDTQSFTINVTNVNDAPTIISSHITSATEDQQYVYDLDATDDDISDTLTYGLTTYPTGMTINETTGVIAWTPTNNQVGTNSVTVVVLDGNGGTDTQSFTINVANVNDPPTITSTPITTATEDTQYIYVVEAIDIDTDILTYSLTTYSTGMVIDSGAGTITWSPANAQVGIHSVVVKVVDGNGGIATQVFTITVANVNDPPVITSTPIVMATEEWEYVYNVLVDDIDPTNDVLTFELTVSPAGMQIDPTIGIITWTPTNDQVGENNVIIKVSDGKNGNITQSFIITVINVNDAPIITSTSVTTATEDTQYTYDVDAQDVDIGDNLTYSLATAPEGMSIDALTGIITWTPRDADVGTHQIVVKVMDYSDAFTTQSFSITVANVNDAPVISNTTISPETGDEKDIYTFTLIYKDPDGDPGTVRLVIDEQEHPMEKVGGDAVTGEVYSIEMSLDVGSHTYYYEIDDGKGHKEISDVYTISVELEEAGVSPLWWIILILVVIIVLVLLYLWKARSQQHPQPIAEEIKDKKVVEKPFVGEKRSLDEVEEKMALLEDKLLSGWISEETYESLRKKYEKK